MRWPGVRTGTEVARTVAARVTHTPSHYAVLGVPRDFTEAQLRKQYRLLALRYHPDAAERNGIDPEEALERFTAMQAAYSVLSDPARRRRYDLELRLQHRREWRRAYEGTTLLLVDKSAGSPTLPHAGSATQPPTCLADSSTRGDESSGDSDWAGALAVDSNGSAEASTEPESDVVAAERAERARQWDVQRVEWLRQHLEAQQANLGRAARRSRSTSSGIADVRVYRASSRAAHAPSRDGRITGRITPAGGSLTPSSSASRLDTGRQRVASVVGQEEEGEGEGEGAAAARAEREDDLDAGRPASPREAKLRAAKFEEAEARRRQAEAEAALRHERERARRKASEAKLRREREETLRAAAEEAQLRADERSAQEVEERVRRQVEERARRQGAEAARIEAAESVRAAEERARLATLAAEEKALRLQVELDALQRQLEEAQAAAAASSTYADAAVGPSSANLFDETGAYDVGGGDAAHGSGRGGGGYESEELTDGEEAVELAVRRVEEATLEEFSARQWMRRAASGDFPEIPPPPTVTPTLLNATPVGRRGGGSDHAAVGPDQDAPNGGGALSELVRWVCIRIPPRATAGETALMDTPYGRFAVLIPAGLPVGSPLLVPVPAGATHEDNERRASLPPATAMEAAREAQLASLMERGFSAQEAAQYCDGTSSVDDLEALIQEDTAVLDGDADADGEAMLDEPNAGHAATATTREGSSFCLIS